MAWIESHQALGGHLKTRRLARALKVHRAQAIGHLHFLWWWALDNAPDGDLSALTPAEISEVAEWPGSDESFVEALKSSKFMDADGVLHDWHEYGGKLIEHRQRDAERKKRDRKSERKRTDEPRPSDVQRTDGGRTADGGRRVQYRTVHNQGEDAATHSTTQPQSPPLNGKLSAAELINRETELKRVEKRMDVIRNGYDSHAELNAKDIAEIRGLKARREILKKMLGFHV